MFSFRKNKKDKKLDCLKCKNLKNLQYSLIDRIECNNSCYIDVYINGEKKKFYVGDRQKRSLGISSNGFVIKEIITLIEY